jgi:hypothetical protein
MFSKKELSNLRSSIGSSPTFAEIMFWANVIGLTEVLVITGPEIKINKITDSIQSRRPKA